jgi:hypothetical protein
MLAKVLFEIIDQLVAPFPDLLGNKLVHPHHQDVLIVRTIEDDDLAVLWHLLLDAPEEVMLGLLCGGRFESMDARALRVHGAKHVVDGSVLAGGIQRLQANQQAALVLSVEKILQFTQFPVEFFDLLDRRFLLRVLGVVRIDLLQADFAAWFYLEQFAISHIATAAGSVGRYLAFINLFGFEFSKSSALNLGFRLGADSSRW